MTWLFDIALAPRGHNITVMRNVRNKDGLVRLPVKEFEPDHVWLATNCGKVIKSYWIPETEKNEGRWAGLGSKEQPKAWQPFVVPVHPDHESDGGAFAAVKATGRLADRAEVKPSLSDRQYLEKIADQVIAHNQTETAEAPAKKLDGGSRAAKSGAGGVASACPALIDDVGGA